MRVLCRLMREICLLNKIIYCKFFSAIDNRTIVRYNTDVRYLKRQRDMYCSEGDFIMERGNTKQEILEASLDLFSVYGFEATSVSQIADAVGIRKASLYSHFENKQAILDALVKEVLEQYAGHSVFVGTDWEKAGDDLPLTSDDAVKMIEGQIRYILHDPHISKARKMLVIEQFRNPELAKLLTERNYTDVLGYFTGIVKQLIRHGVLADYDSEIMAAQLCLPVSEWINLCDREPERETEILELVEKHIRQFFRLYRK